MAPRVTVWIPSYEHAPYLPAAIESVLAQTLEDLELVLVEDGSRDGSLEIARRYAAAQPDRVTVLTHPGHANRGVEASARLAFQRSRGGYLLGLASDDVLLPEALARGADFLDRHPAAGFVYAYAHLIDASGARIPSARTFGIDVTGGGRTLERLIQGNTIPSMTAVIRRECLEQTGGHDGSVVYSDWELFARIAAHWDAGFIPRALALHRVHAANTSHQPPDVTRARSLEVTARLRERAPEVGGRLAGARIRATLDLQMAFLRFTGGDERAAAVELAAAFARDPSLARDPRRLADWVWSRALDGLLPDARPSFAGWAREEIGGALEPAAARGFRRDAAAAMRAERAVALARQGRPGASRRAALGAAFLSPRRIADRRLAAVLLDAAPDGLAHRGVRATRRALTPHR
jgi:alpha-1,3-rhamnosyltransferase